MNSTHAFILELRQYTERKEKRARDSVLLLERIISIAYGQDGS